VSEMPEFVRRAIEAQGKVDPDEVAAKAAELDDDMHDEDEYELPPIDEGQEAMVLDEDPRGYTYEP
jgi:hypothetical protein